MSDKALNKLSVKRVKYFIEHDIWRINPDPKKHRFQAFLVKTAKILIYAFQGVIKDDVQLRASALTFFSLLSIVPLLAMAFGIAKGFDLEKQFQEKLMENFHGQAEVIDKSLEFARQLLENTQGGLVAGIGFGVLAYSVIRLFSNIEISFNSIWEVKQERTLVRKLTDYLAIVLLAPVFLIAASSLTYQITQTIQELTSMVEILGFFERFILPLLGLLPYTIVWALFTLMYMIMPNTHVKFQSAFIAAIIAGTAYQLTQWGLINFQVGVARYNAIYGSFAALPLFLFWLQLSWLIFLFGAEVAFSHQNVGKYEKEYQEKDLSRKARLEAIFVLINRIVKRFIENKPAYSFSNLAEQLHLPVKIAHTLLEQLVTAGILTRTEDKDGDLNCYQPATEPAKITFSYVMDKLDSVGNTTIWEEGEFDDRKFREQMQIMHDEVSKSSGALALKDL
jgi:membrane protein